jgi:hypothetical protein
VVAPMGSSLSAIKTSFNTLLFQMMKFLRVILCVMPISLFGQTITDGLMMSKKDLCTGFIYSNDKWSKYWEGSLKRENGNIGTLTTQSLAWVAAYGVTDRINVIAMVPYVKTQANQGTLVEMKGIQDLTVAVKYNFFQKKSETSELKTFAALSFSTPLSDYTPDFFPLSLGTGTTNISWRATTYYRVFGKFYTNVSGAYTWRSNTTLDRSSYYTKDHLYMTNEVEMPNVFDYGVSFGYLKNGLQVDLGYTQQNTLGGSDIRRQDMPFVSNRMNFSKVGLMGLYYVKILNGLAVRGSISQTIAGRNVGLSRTYMAGVLYTIHFSVKEQ